MGRVPVPGLAAHGRKGAHSLRVMTGARAGFELVVDGRAVTVADERATLLDVVREQLGIRSVKDGCSPQGQCGCCTVLVDGQARVACVTPARRVAGRRITTLDGLDHEVRDRWTRAFAEAGASQCGFCTPGIICRFAALDASGSDHGDRAAAARALAAHLCRCTGWQPILDAWCAYPGIGPNSGPTPGNETDHPAAGPDAAASNKAGRIAVSSVAATGDSASRNQADRRAAIEGRSPQATGPQVAAGGGGFADDTAPEGALVAVLSADWSGWVTGDTAAEARAAAGTGVGRRATAAWGPPLDPPSGRWDVTLSTSWVEPGYLETDASWCEPGGEPASPLGNGGAFGGKRNSPVTEAARQLADEHQRPVRVLWSRPDAARFGPKRPPIGAGVRADGTGVVRVARTPGIVKVIKGYAPGLEVEELDVAGPSTSCDVRGAGWVEAAVLLAAVRGANGPVEVVAPDGGRAEAMVNSDGSLAVSVRAGRALDETVLRSYCTGAAHMALSWVTSESLSVDEAGTVHDLTVRSFGIVGASAMPPVEVAIEPDDGEPVNGSDAAFAAVAAAVWIDRGLPPVWPTG